MTSLLQATSASIRQSTPKLKSTRTMLFCGTYDKTCCQALGKPCIAPLNARWMSDGCDSPEGLKFGKIMALVIKLESVASGRGTGGGGCGGGLSGGGLGGGLGGGFGGGA